MSPLAIGTVVVTFLAWMTKTPVRTNQGQRVYFGCLRGLKPWQLGPRVHGQNTMTSEAIVRLFTFGLVGARKQAYRKTPGQDPALR